MKTHRILFTSAILCLTAIPAAALPTPTIGIGGEFMQSSNTQFDKSKDGFTLRKASAEITYTQPYGIASSATIGCSVGRLDYDFDKNAINNLSWEKINEFNALMMVSHNINASWNAVGLGFIRSAYDTEARFEDSITWGTGLGFQHNVSDTLSFVYGLAYLTRLERDGLVLPVFGIEWQITDRLKMNGLMGLDLEYDLWGDASGFLNAGFDCELTDFRVKRDPLTGRKSAVEPNVGAFYVSYSHKLTDQASFFVKVSTYGEQKYETYSDDRKISTVESDSFMLYGAGFNLVF